MVGSSSLSTRAKKNSKLRLRKYIEDTYDEIVNKVTWPTWEELIESSVIVLVSSAILALIIWMMDFSFGVNPSGIWKGLMGLIYSIAS